jgi:SAM-dependent methyltransferase
MSSPSDSSLLSLPSVAFFGRTFDECCQCLGLDGAALRGLRILDAAAGPSSFAAEAAALGADPVALDPLYGCGLAALEAYVEVDYARMFRELRRREALLSFASFPSLAAAEASRRSAAARFLRDYEEGFVRGRYVGGGLPRLPFPDRSFDLAVCGHLLFLHAARFDLAWHAAACRELARVSAGEVRIHPVCGLDGRPYGGLEPLRRELAAAGIASRIEPVAHRFFPGADTVLILGARPESGLPSPAPSGMPAFLCGPPPSRAR